LVDLIESAFVPLCIYNNHKGTDAVVLARYDEPSWNNPVVRFFAADRRELLARKDGVWSLPGITTRTQDALEAGKVEVPAWFGHFERELDARGVEKAVFAMHCFWEGERRLGALPGVLTTHAGWLDGAEVVEIAFDPKVLSFGTLLEEARKVRCLQRVFARTEAQSRTAQGIEGVSVVTTQEKVRDAKTSDRHYYLRRTPYTHLALTPGQATRLNAALGMNQPVDGLLSPRQQKHLAQIRAHLAKDPKALDDLPRPDTIAALPAYRAALRARLAD